LSSASQTYSTRPDGVSHLVDDSNRQLLIDGRLVDAADGLTMEVVSPVDGRPVTMVPAASAPDVDLAVSAAARAFDPWRWTDISIRRTLLLSLAAYLRSDAHALGLLDTLDAGIPATIMLSEVELAAASVEYFAGLASEWGGRQIPTGSRSIDFTLREPFGVTAKIIPFNHPLLFAVTKIAAPLLTGNTVVLKLPDQTPLSGLRLAAYFAEAFPSGVVNILSGTGPAVGDPLVRHPQVRRVGFTGSVNTARVVLHGAADNIVPALLELGGKNPLILCADADLNLAIKASIVGMNYKSAGQSCGSFSRLFLHDDIYDEALERLIVATQAVRVRNPFSSECDMGPLIASQARERAERYISETIDFGARLAVGGSRPVGPEFGDGWYLEPAVLEGVTDAMPIASEEIFGPVLAVSRWSDELDVIARANDTEYGLTAGVWSRDIDRALRIAHSLEVGTVTVNGDGGQHWVGAPYGGCKHSGYGKEESFEELLESTRLKNINISVH
jgi:betaine-aldehyde dehydrogenase